MREINAFAAARQRDRRERPCAPTPSKPHGEKPSRTPAEGELGAHTFRRLLENGVLYLPQELSERDVHAQQAWLSAAGKAERGAVLSIVASLNTDVKELARGETSLSPGEVRKLMIARGVLSAAHTLVMDEPTNHLDVHSVEALEQALAAFRGALVVVSHDEAFLQACTDARWTIAEGALSVS